MKMPDKIEMYAAALDSDISAERFQRVENGTLKTYFHGTVYGMGIATNERGHAFSTFEDAYANACLFVEKCAEIVSERAAISRADEGEA
jgi:hypothetical protein